MKTCTIDGCTARAIGHGLCRLHYDRERNLRRLRDFRDRPAYTVCPTCGSSVKRGWTGGVGRAHKYCLICETAAMFPHVETDPDRRAYWRAYYERRKARAWKEVRGGR